MDWFIPARVPLPQDFLGFDPHDPRMQEFQVYERHLPHWRAPGRCFFITFRTRDSIPLEVMQQMKEATVQWQLRLSQAALNAGGRLPPDEWAAWQDFQQVQMRKLEFLLDEGHGECLLRFPEHRQPLIEALHHFEGSRCQMLAYTVMPNHVHVLCRPLGKHSPDTLSRSWKRHSGDRIHRALGRAGSFWQEESFDRIIRDADHYFRVVRYIAKNPVQARLRSEEAAVWLHPQILTANT